MIHYFKLLIISFICSVFVAFPVSSGGHFAYLNNVLTFTTDKNEASFYFSIISFVFSIASLICVRKLYFKGFKALGRKYQGKDKDSYKKMFVGILISLASSLVMIIPCGKGKLLSDIFVSFLNSKDMLVVASGSIFGGICSIAAIWYSRVRAKEVKRSASNSDIIRMTCYSLLSNFFPGFSKMSVASNSLIVSGVSENSVIRDALLYMSPAIFLLSLIRIIRCLVSGVGLDPIMIGICAIVSAFGSYVSLSLIRRVNIKSIIIFFSVYSVIFGIGTLLTVFFLL